MIWAPRQTPSTVLSAAMASRTNAISGPSQPRRASSFALIGPPMTVSMSKSSIDGSVELRCRWNTRRENPRAAAQSATAAGPSNSTCCRTAMRIMLGPSCRLYSGGIRGEPSRVAPRRTIQLIDKFLFHECGTRRRMIQDADALHELERRESVSATACGYCFWRIIVSQNDPHVAPVEASFQKPSLAQIEVRVEKQPYQLCIERPEHLPPIRRTRGPVLVHNIDKIGMMSALVGAMIAHRVAHGAHDTWITRHSAQDGRNQRLRDRDERDQEIIGEFGGKTSLELFQPAQK